MRDAANRIVGRPQITTDANFCRVDATLRVTLAMEAGISDCVCSVEELVTLLPEPQAKKRGPYKRRLLGGG